VKQQDYDLKIQRNSSNLKVLNYEIRLFKSFTFDRIKVYFDKNSNIISIEKYPINSNNIM
jgi:hypothetical protein